MFEINEWLLPTVPRLASVPWLACHGDGATAHDAEVCLSSSSSSSCSVPHPISPS